MMKATYLRLMALLAFISVSAFATETQPLTQDETTELAFKIEDSKSYVGIAAVKLSVSKLVQEDGQLVGDYSINVPLSKSNNDTGRIVLPIDIPLHEIGEEGGTLRGKAYSNKEGKKPNLIVCKIGPLTDKDIKLAITTEKRTLNFDSSYVLIDNQKDTQKDS
ncbi:MAG: hypothetical protein ACPGES_01035 [Coraliomargarita sp.]